MDYRLRGFWIGAVILLAMGIIAVIRMGVYPEEVMAVAVVDRIEGSYAVLEFSDRTVVNLPLRVCGTGIREGERLILRRDSGGTRRNMQRLVKLMRMLFE